VSVQTIATIEDDLGFFDDWEDRYRYLIDLGKTLPAMPDHLKVADNIVHGCTSQVWLDAQLRTANGAAQQATDVVELQMDSDALIVRGLLALVASAYAGKTPAAIVEYDINALFERLDLLSHLSMTRGNGLQAMVTKIQSIAAALASCTTAPKQGS